MIKRMAFITAKAGMSREAFKDHYENVHAPLGRKLFPMFKDYRRNYLGDVVRRPNGVPHPGYDAINEITFANEADYQAYLAEAAKPEILAQILEDEAKFMEPNTLWGFIVEERDTPKLK